MPRPLWKGAISFGMVTIPVKLYTATEEKDVRFHMLHEKDMARIRQKRFCSDEEVEVENDEIVKGYELSPGRYVVLEDEDFEKVPVNSTHTIEISEFVSLEDIDPILYQKTYYLEPEDIGAKPFALLMRALEETGRVAIAKVTLRQKEQLCSLRLYGKTLALETLYYSDEVRSTGDLAVPSAAEVSARELDMAKSLVEMLSGDFNLEQYRDNYRGALLDIIKKKSEGEAFEAPEAAPVKITDLTEALRASVEALRRTKTDGRVALEEPEERPSRRRRAS